MFGRRPLEFGLRDSFVLLAFFGDLVFEFGERLLGFLGTLARRGELLPQISGRADAFGVRLCLARSVAGDRLLGRLKLLDLRPQQGFGSLARLAPGKLGLEPFGLRFWDPAVELDLACGALALDVGAAGTASAFRVFGRHARLLGEVKFDAFRVSKLISLALRQRRLGSRKQEYSMYL